MDRNFGFMAQTRDCSIFNFGAMKRNNRSSVSLLLPWCRMCRISWIYILNSLPILLFADLLIWRPLVCVIIQISTSVQ